MLGLVYRLVGLWTSAVRTALAWPFRNRLRPDNWQQADLYLMTGAFVVSCVVVWLLQWWLAPRWLVGSVGGLQTVMQVMPAAVVAVLVLMLGSVLVLGQQLVAAYGTRAVLLLLQNRALLAAVIRPLIVTIAALFVAGQVPQTQQGLSDLATAGATTLVLATALIFASSVLALTNSYLAYITPVNFSRTAVEGAGEYLRSGVTGMVEFRIGMLSEMLTTALRREDVTAAFAAVGGLDRLTADYIAAVEVSPAAKTHQYDRAPMTGWLGFGVAQALLTGAEMALKVDAAERVVTLLGDTQSSLALQLIEAHLVEDAEHMIVYSGLAATSPFQVKGGGVANVYVQGDAVAVDAECKAEEAGELGLAALALATWAAVQVYVVKQFGVPKHYRYDFDLTILGPNPPWDEAAAMMRDDSRFARGFRNKMPWGWDELRRFLAKARRDHRRLVRQR